MLTQRISVVIPLYYCSPDLYQVIRKCFKSLEGYDIELIVVDDCSPLEHDFPVTCRNETNKGFTATVNKGLGLSTADTIVVMNDDIQMTQECFEKFLQLPNNTIASPADTASSNDDKFGACWGMRRSVYKLLGPLNEEYKHFYSDTEYYNRAKSHGVSIIKWKGIVLEHPESSTYKKVDKNKLIKADAETYLKNQRTTL